MRLSDVTLKPFILSMKKLKIVIKCLSKMCINPKVYFQTEMLAGIAYLPNLAVAFAMFNAKKCKEFLF